VGRYILYDRETGETAATGVFSLTLRETDAGWKIVHDHSSSG
jgi:ketosteroid isomerase-like protein